ncbi:MAG: outer membrane beta-barrel protein [Gemmatimonadetes bacterium]|nr:outer membrane beta-barrel protein [Gemmatimonadota bacterium]
MRASRKKRPRGARRTFAVTAAVALLATLFAGSAFATGVGVRGAWVDAPDTDENLHMIGGFVRVGGPVQLEGAVDYRNESLPGGVDVRTWPVTASLIVAPIPYVYGLAGIGWYNTTIDFTSESNVEDTTKREFGWHAGAGTQVPILPSLSFVADLRYAYVDYQFDEFAESVARFDGGDYVTLNLGLMLGSMSGVGSN